MTPRVKRSCRSIAKPIARTVSNGRRLKCSPNIGTVRVSTRRCSPHWPDRRLDVVGQEQQSTRPKHPCHLGERAPLVIDRAEREGAHDCVETAVREGQRPCVALLRVLRPDRRLGRPGGTLLIVGHLRTPGSTGHGHRPPAETSVTPAAITARLDGMKWKIVTAEERLRALTGHGGRPVTLHDVVVRATRRQ